MAHEPTTVYLSDRTKKTIKKLAEENKISFSTIVETAIRLYHTELQFQKGK